jgi:anti-sigma-K factor RskA
MPDVDEPDHIELTAAEYVLGVLGAEEHAAARDRAASEPAFAHHVQAWERRVTPLILQVPEVAPPASVWPRIAAGLPVAAGETLRSGRPWDSLLLWRGLAAAATVAAAALVVVVSTPRPAPTPVPAQAPTMVMASAKLATEQGQALFVVTYEANSRKMVVSPMTSGGAPGHSHELWLIPAEGAPVSLGLMPADAPASMTVPEGVAPNSALAISVEPEGGSPTGLPTGPVIAQGRLAPV